MRRIVVTGPESTGKTTLAAAVASRLGAPWLSEASRAYAEERRREGRTLTADDAGPIAHRTIDAEDATIASGATLLVLDTDLVSTVLYARHYYGSCPGWIEAEARARRGDLYLLCAPDLPWVADGVRDRPSERESMHATFVEVLAEFGCAVAPVSGAGAARERAGWAAIEAALAAGARR